MLTLASIDHFRYLYTGNLNSPSGLNIMKVLELAERYRVADLVKMLIAKQLQRINVEDFSSFVSKNENHMTDLIKFKCFEYVFLQPEAVFKSQNFKLFPLSFLIEILSHERLVLNEDIICEAILQWSENECKNEGIPVTGENQREVLKELVYELRPTLLSKEFFDEKFSEVGILSPNEEVVVLKHFLNSKKPMDPKFKFKTQKRVAPLTPFTYSTTGDVAPDEHQIKLEPSSDLPIEHPLSAVVEHKIERFIERGLGWGYRDNKKDAVAVKISKDIRIDYVYLYGPCKSDGKMEVTLVIQNEKVELSCTEVQIPCTVANPLYEVGVENANGSYGVRLNANETYHIVALIKGENGFYGKNGISNHVVEGVKIEFSESRFSSNNTNVQIGQIAGFKFTVV